jgi:Cu/Zn superoxide dismutase
LLAHEAGDLCVVPLVDVLIAGASCRAADDQRGAGLIDQDGVDLVDDREEVVALYPIVQAHDHVVAEVVEAELVVRAVGDVTLVGRSTFRGAGGRVVQAAHRKAEELVHRTHPLRVAACEVVIDRDEVGTAAGERVQIQRHRGHEGLPLTGGHLGDLALVEDDGTDQLNIVRHHVPGHLQAGDDDLFADETPARLAYRRESLGEDLVEDILGGLGELGLGLGHAQREALSSDRVFRATALISEILEPRLVLVDSLADSLPEALRLSHELVVGERREALLVVEDLVDDRLELLHRAFEARSEHPIDHPLYRYHAAIS